MRAVAVFTGMLTGVLSVTGLLSAGAYAAGEKGICLHPRRRQTPEYSRCIWGHAGGLQPGLVGETLTVINDQDYPMLVQSEVLSEDQKSPAPFVVTPPLFRLDGQQSSRLRIVRTGGEFPSDRESLQWICVKGIPPKEDDRWAEGKDGEKKADKVSLNVQLSVSSCIKLFVRPPAVKGQPDDVAGKVEWQRAGNRLKGLTRRRFTSTCPR